MKKTLIFITIIIFLISLVIGFRNHLLTKKVSNFIELGDQVRAEQEARYETGLEKRHRDLTMDDFNREALKDSNLQVGADMVESMMTAWHYMHGPNKAMLSGRDSEMLFFGPDQQNILVFKGAESIWPTREQILLIMKKDKAGKLALQDYGIRFNCSASLEADPVWKLEAC